jgi:hypothetical protein
VAVADARVGGNASTTVGSSSTSRVLLNFDARTTTTPSAQSMSSRSRAMVSPTRMPGPASRPIMVWNAAARNGVGTSRDTAFVSASTSPSE